jgi:hypothetical protein
MALAILRFLESDDRRSRFQVDLGTNRFYTYAIAENKVIAEHGIKRLQDPHFTSQLIGAVPESSQGRTFLDVPHSQFDRRHRAIQITSYRTDKRESPAISNIVQVLIPSASSGSSSLSLGLEAMEKQSVDLIPFSYREAEPISSAMFLSSLTAMIPKILPALKTTATQAVNVAKKAMPAIAGALPTALPLLGTLVGAVGGGAPAQQQPTIGPDGQLIPAPDPGGQPGLMARLMQAATTPETAQQIAALLQQVSQVPPANPSPAVAQSYDTDATALSVPPQYVHEMAIPAALLTMLPSLMPLLQQVLSPETLKTVMDNLPSNKMLGAVTEGLKQVGGMIQESEKRTIDHLEKIMPQQTDMKEIHNLFRSLSLGMGGYSPVINYQRIEAVRLQITGATPLKLNGRSRLLYSRNHEVTFHLTVTTPQTIKQGTVQVVVKNPATLEVLLEQKFPVSAITSGSKLMPKLSVEQLKTLPANDEYLVCIYLLWSARSRRTGNTVQMGNSMTQLITVLGDYGFDRIEGQAQVVPLNDVNKHRAYWHNVWQGNFSSAVRQVNLDCKYYYVLESERANYARMETLVKTEVSGKKEQAGKLKTGLVLTPAGLNELVSQISKYPRLDVAQLAALSGSEFQKRFHHCAQTQVQFKGRGSDRIALWVYPEFKVQPVILKKVERVDEAGHIVTLSDHMVWFPLPTVAHFVGTKS